MEDLSSNPGELTEEQSKLLNRETGAKILTQSGFRGSHQEIVDSSFEKARKHGEKLVGKNDERRNDAYLSRLEKLVDKYGNSIEKIAWAESIKDDLLIKYENITESYWESKKQELRDNGYGSIELTEKRKHEIFEKELKLQRKSLEKWANYLGDEHSPYPLWFKIYAWDGMIKMGKYDKSKGGYAVRNKTTVAPYPDPDAEVLGGVFEVVNRYYGNNERKFYTEEGERNIGLEKLVQSGNFAKIFNAVQKDIAPIIEPPENPEDVQGDWVEYGIGEEDDIARAARGTGWCVASSSVGRHYLEYGTFGGDDDWDDDYDDELDDERGDESSSVQSKFILFHLQDPSTRKLSKNAVASIRLDPDGTVAEISGLKDGQALNDSLVSIVEEKVKTLPGGEEFLPKFADKQLLIRLDRKMQNNEDLTKEELEFLYEINRPIATLDTYNSYDPRIDELRKKYNIDYILGKNIDTDQFIPKMDLGVIAENLDTLIRHDVNIDIDQLVSKLDLKDILWNLDTLIRHGANIDINQLVSEMDSEETLWNWDTLIQHGANIDIDQLVSRMNVDNILWNWETLIQHGANIDINQLVSEMDPNDILWYLDTLIQYGANIDINQFIYRIKSYDIINNWDELIQCGANTDQLVSRMTVDDIIDNWDVLIQHGVDIDINQLISRMGSYDIVGYWDTLIQHGASIDQLVSKIDPYVIAKKLDTLIQYGANIDINQLVSELDEYEIIDNLDTLIQHGANIDINQLISRKSPSLIIDYLDTLIQHGANIDQLANIIQRQTHDWDDKLREYGWQG